MDRNREISPALELVVDIKSDDVLHGKPAPDFIPKRIESVIGRLLKTHEEEWRRISREIHDDIGGRVTEIALLIQQIRRKSAALPKSIVTDLDELEDKTIETSRAIGNLSHRLHSPVLEFTGITIALQTLCREFQAHTGIRIVFAADPNLTDIPADVALCIYRIAQESLSNIAKHSGAKTAKVELTRTSDEAQLTIRDFGHGFTSRSKRKSGLGLISMEERVRLLQGTLQVQTQHGAGTQVRTTLPLNPRKTVPTPQTKRAAGRR